MMSEPGLALGAHARCPFVRSSSLFFLSRVLKRWHGCSYKYITYSVHVKLENATILECNCIMHANVRTVHGDCQFEYASCDYEQSDVTMYS